MTDRTPQQEQELAQAREERVRLADDIMNCGFPSVAGWPFLSNVPCLKNATVGCLF